MMIVKGVFNDEVRYQVYINVSVGDELSGNVHTAFLLGFRW